MSRKTAPAVPLPDAGAWTFAKFVVAGGGTAGLFLVLCYVFAKGGLPPFLASVGAYALAFGIGYTLQRGWTFNAQHRHRDAFPRYLALQVGCGLFSGVVSQIAVAGFGLSPLAMSLATTLIAGGVSFVLSRFWVFPHEGKDTEQPV